MSPRIFEVGRERVADAVKAVHGLRSDVKGVADAVKAVVDDVRLRSDEALFEYARRFDGVVLGRHSVRVSKAEMNEALSRINPALRKALERVEVNIRSVARLQLSRLGFSKKVLPGVEIVQRPIPLSSVGCYVPGGAAAYPSTALMTSVPAKVAGVGRIVVCTPSDRDGRVSDPVLAALRIAGVDEVYRVGGPHAIAAMAYGCQSIPQVDKIVGPGGPYVTAAKHIVSSDVAVDMLAGATELVVYADNVAEAEDAAYELCAQAEHSKDTVVGLVTTSSDVAGEVSRFMSLLSARMERSSVIAEAWERNGFIAVCDDVSTAAEFINGVAPEHLSVISSSPKRLISKIANAGLISVGRYTSPALCDYVVGVNHVLPTHGVARVRAGLSVYDFVKPVFEVRVSRGAAGRLGRAAAVLARAEGLGGHAASVERWVR
ncbi:MAG: histidinol dehydrogenase [Nitrososphaerota archaeon]